MSDGISDACKGAIRRHRCETCDELIHVGKMHRCFDDFETGGAE